ncbi:MAG: GFA family protein [Pseudomonadales bacterium]|nr:GFA family protein [Pseudomonadales bacterium]MCP5358394.1 GFA family protein [Pseudomonadales bacterium]
MKPSFSPLSGACRCGRVRFEVSAPPLITMACHCRGCQRMSASAFSLSAAFPTQAFRVTQGEAIIGGLHGDDVHHYCCPHCMSWMFTRIPGMDMFVNVRSSLLNDPQPFAPFIESWTSEKLRWASTPAVHSYAQFPPMEAYEALLLEYEEFRTKQERGI